jgi:dienelactone hydrolase
MKSTYLATIALAAWAALLLALSQSEARAAVKTEPVAYAAGGTALKGYLAYDYKAKGKRPGVVVFTDWYGMTDYAQARARKLAGFGYVVLIADLFGNGTQNKTDQQAMAAVGAFRNDPKLLPARYDAALSQLRANPRVDPRKLVAMGYCFGARAALGIARSGADIVAIVTFHGDVTNPEPTTAKNIKGHVLVFWGANDPHVTAKDMDAFADEMRQSQADWEIVTYANTVHSFTVPTAHSATDAYNATADRRSWQQMTEFLHEVLR